MGQRAIAPPTAYLNKFIFIISSSLKVLLISIIACHYENLRFHAYDTKSLHMSPPLPPPPVSYVCSPSPPENYTSANGGLGWKGGGEGGAYVWVCMLCTYAQHTHPHICTTCTPTHMHNMHTHTHMHNMHTHTYAQHAHPHICTTCTPTHICTTCTPTHICTTCTLTHMHNMHTHTYAQHAHPHICTTCTPTHMHNMHTHTYAQHAHPHTYAQHAHPHICTTCTPTHICTTCTPTHMHNMHTHTYAQHAHPHICTTCTPTHMHNMHTHTYAHMQNMIAHNRLHEWQIYHFPSSPLSVKTTPICPFPYHMVCFSILIAHTNMYWPYCKLDAIPQFKTILDIFVIFFFAQFLLVFKTLQSHP